MTYLCLGFRLSLDVRSLYVLLNILNLHWRIKKLKENRRIQIVKLQKQKRLGVSMFSRVLDFPYIHYLLSFFKPASFNLLVKLQPVITFLKSLKQLAGLGFWWVSSFPSGFWEKTFRAKNKYVFTFSSKERSTKFKTIKLNNICSR